MREILFRGKRLDNGEWVYGAFVPDATERTHGDMVTWGFIRRHNIESGRMESIEVDRKTVGQYTGLKDKNGQEIFEGDIVRDIDTSKVFEIMYRGHMFLRYERKPMYMFYTLDGDCLEVIGNIHDNPDLLEEEYQC